ncbi:MAG: ACT domain-containing protein [Eubacteriaceae bacterium]|mgnify:FL=1|jgi:aspartate kinase|nr:ACT domain-containing protein [Eubacteriaceae bacterium]
MTMKRSSIQSIFLDDDIAKISILELPDKPGIAFKLFSLLTAEDVKIDMIVQNVNRQNINDISFTVRQEQMEQAVQTAQKFAFEVNAQKVIYDKSVAKLSVVGSGLVASTEMAAIFFEALSEIGVNIQMISTSEVMISCIIDKEQSKEAMKHVYKKFEDTQL